MLLLIASALAQPEQPERADGDRGLYAPGADAQAFLDLYTSMYLSFSTLSAEANWDASTDVSELHEGRRTGADQAWSAFAGDPVALKMAKSLLETAVSPIQKRQLQSIVYRAGANPGHLPALLNARVAAEARAAGVQDGFTFCFTARAADGTCPAPKAANDIDELLQSSKNLDERLVAWNAAKEIGRPLKAELVELRRLRNQVAREMGYSSYFGYMVADYGLSADEMMAILDGFVTDSKPLYGALHAWATNTLAKRYAQPAPAGDVPAHWYPNRWAQEWGGLVEGVDLDPYFKDRSPEWIVRASEQFYTSMGFAPMQQSFWDKSDLYPLPEGSARHKNSHASAWHVDLREDIRSLMSVEPNAQWFFTSHHELGHIYYYKAYTRDAVPPLLREGANRAFHEGIGELASIAAGQVPYLRQTGVLPKKVKIDQTKALLEDALSRTVAFIPWSAGVMARFEYELYEKDLPPDQWQKRWWELASKYQGVAPPDAARLTDPDLCDPCTKTHIIDDPAGYYDYALATVIKHQLHEHIATKILKQDPHDCNYYGNKAVGAYIQGILEKGATEDWRKVLKDATGEELSTRAMVAYYKPLESWLAKENARAR